MPSDFKMLTGEDGKRYVALCAKLRDAANSLDAAIRTHGMDSKEFAEADSAFGVIYKEMRALQGHKGPNWT